MVIYWQTRMRLLGLFVMKKNISLYIKTSSEPGEAKSMENIPIFNSDEDWFSALIVIWILLRCITIINYFYL